MVKPLSNLKGSPTPLPLILLRAARLALGLRYTLIIRVWQALRDQDANYTIFVHLRDTVDHAYAQGDGQPRGGWYPTAVWRNGEVVIDSHIIPLPPGPTPPLSLVIGVALLDQSQRLPAFDTGGSELRDDEAVLEQNLVFP